jgi:hypothetical protein
VEDEGGGDVVGEHAGDVRGGRKASNHLPAEWGVRLQLAAQRVEVKEAILVLGNAHDLRADLAPRQQVRVVLARAHEHHRGCGQLQAVDQLVHGARAAVAGEDDGVVLRGVDCVSEYVSGLMPVMI